MKQSFDLTGSQVLALREFPIAAATDIDEGCIVKLATNLVVKAAATETGAILGIAAENHGGSADAFNTRANGTKILVYCSPSAAYEGAAVVLTASGGSTTTIVASTLADFGAADDVFNGGYAKLASKGASSTNTDAVGTIYGISDFDASEKTFTINAAGGAVTAADTFEIYPPIGFVGGNFNANISDVVLTATAALPIKVVGWDVDAGKVFYAATLHEFGNKKA